MRSDLKTYPNFLAFMREAVLPLKDSHPEWLRLDGKLTGGSRETFARFIHDGHVWEVREDTHIEPLKIALDAAESGKEPFLQEPTSRSSTRQCLVLKPEIDTRKKRKPRLHYIYS